MKKLLALLLALACLLGLTACGGEKLEEPPELRIVSDDGTVTAIGGNYDWTVENALGSASSTISCGAHPLDCQNFVETLFTDDPTVELDFAVRGDYVYDVECWSDEHWGNMNAESETAELTSVNDTLNVTLKQGGWVYQVTAKWERKHYNGTCSYVFHVVTPELQAAE